MKKAETEQEIHARLRQLADDARRLREELAQSTRQRIKDNAMADERPAAPRVTRRRSKNKTR